MQGLQHRWKETPAQVFSCEYCRIFNNSFFFIEHFRWLLLNFSAGSQKETVFSINCSVRKTFKYSLSIDVAFNMSMWCSERTPKPETIFYRLGFLTVIIYRYFWFLYMQKIYSFYLCQPPLFLLPFTAFVVLLAFIINFKFNFGLNFNTITFLLKL